MKSRIALFAVSCLLAACGISLPTAPTATPGFTPEPSVTLSPAETPTSAFTPTITPTYTPDTRPLPRAWASWPIIPTVSARAVEIYRQGIQMDAIPYTFSVVGDCQSEPEVFLGIYATYRNPIDETNPLLLETINLFRDSFLRDSVAVRGGLSAPTALDPLWNDPERCNATESPLTCELRLSKPMLVFVNLGTTWRADASVDSYERYLRSIVEQIIDAGAVPILLNKADNVEGGYAINRVTAQAAYDYDVPYVNFWLVSDSLVNHGLDPDMNPPNVYLTPTGWNARNYTALRALDSIWRGLLSFVP